MFISNAGKITATAEFKREVEVRIAVMGVDAASKGFSWGFGFTSLPPFLKYQKSETINEKTYETSTAIVALRAPITGSVTP